MTHNIAPLAKKLVVVATAWFGSKQHFDELVEKHKDPKGHKGPKDPMVPKDPKGPKTQMQRTTGGEPEPTSRRGRQG